MKDSYGNTEFSLSGWLRGKDVLIRHKWPGEKPEYDNYGDNEYLVYDGDFVKANYHPDGYFFYFNADECVDMSEPIYWWNLPNVEE